MWWLAQDGTILVDGIETASDSAFGGVIVNLTGEHVRLSVDRRRIISLSEQVLDERLRAALPTLIAEGHSLLGMEWLWWLAQIRPTVADWLLPAVLEHGVAPPLPSGKCFDLEVAGCFYPDIQLLAGSPWMTDEGRSHVGTVGSIPDEIAAWRLASLVRAGVTISGLRVDSLPLANKNLSTLPALPSDCELLLIDSKPYDTRWVMRDTPVPAGHVFKVAESLRRPVPAVCDRLRELGYAVPDEASLLADRTLASRNLDGKAPWRVSTSPLTAKELSFIAERLGVDDVEIAGRLRGLGYDASPVVDAILTDEGRPVRRVRLSPEYPLRAESVLRAARELGRDVTEVADRYRDLGFDVADAVGSLELMALNAREGRQLWEINRGRIRDEWVAQAAGAPDEQGRGHAPAAQRGIRRARRDARSLS